MTAAQVTIEGPVDGADIRLDGYGPRIGVARRVSPGRWVGEGVAPSESASAGGAVFRLAGQSRAHLVEVIAARLAAHRGRS